MSQPLPATQLKGQLIEDLVERLHRHTGYVIRPRVRLSTVRNSRRYREIDVLATGEMLGRTMHLAFECKNYGKRIGVPKVDEFRGKLEAVGIPMQHGIMIASAHGYTADALERATDLGMTMLVLDGLSNDRLATVAHEAFQSVVYVLLSITKITITNDLPAADWDELLFLRDRGGQVQGSIMDLVWAQWRDGRIPLELGEYDLSIRVPRDWYWHLDGPKKDAEAKVTVRTTAFVVTLSGEAEHVSLRHAQSGKLERAQIRATFPEDPTGRLQVVRATTEEELQALLNAPSKLHITVHRVPMPRIAYLLYWPPSEQAIARLEQHFHQLIRAGQYDFEQHKLTFLEIEGSDLARIWDPIWSAHPASKDLAWPWSKPRRPRSSKVTTRPRQVKKRRRM